MKKRNRYAEKWLLLCACIFPLLLRGQDAPEPAGTLSYRQQIDALIAGEAIQKAFSLIRDQDARTLADHILLTEIEAPPFQEEKRAVKFMAMLQEAGADSVWIDAEGNVLALRRGKAGGKTVVLDAHLDTVFPEGTDVSVKVSGDTLFAPGVSDDTRGLAMVLAVLRAMNGAAISTEADVLFIGSVGEEGLGDLRGVKYLFGENGPRIDAWISIDGGDLGRVCYQGLGSRRFGVSFRGPGGHSWGAFGLANPHHALGSAIHYFVKAADDFTREGPRTSYNIGRIGGGTSVNSIPFASWMEIDMRSHRPERLDSLERILRQSVQRALEEQNSIRRSGRPLSVTVELIGDRPSGELPETTPLIQRALAAAAPFGVSPVSEQGSTNSNIPIARGIPAVTIGRGGRGAGAHSLAEWWSNKEGFLAIQYALLLLVAESGLAD